MTVVRPLRDDDVAASVEVQVASFGALDAAEGRPERPPDDRVRALAALRVRHLVATDPDGCVVAEVDGRVAGVALALRRGPLWFLSLLVVDPQAQSAGLGGAMLDAVLATADGAAPAFLCSSNDPRALRRYGRAGFAMHPAWDADGPLDRSLLPAVDGVRTGDWGRDGGLVDDLVARRRGAGYGPDLTRWSEDGLGLLVDEAGAGYAVVKPGRVQALAAEDEATATRLLWAALAESTGEATAASTGLAVSAETSVEALTGDQQWAVAVAHAARLTLRPGTGIGVRDGARPPALYVPSGAYG